MKLTKFSVFNLKFHRSYKLVAGVIGLGVVFQLPLGQVVAQTIHSPFRTASPSPQALIPGTGNPVKEVGDDFEDEQWSYRFNLPKIYNDGETTMNRNLPAGIAENQRWYEGAKRGQPDQIERVLTPAGGLPGSHGALLLRSLQTGGSRPTYRQQQDDFVANVYQRIGKVPVSQSPSVVTRVWLPPIDQWIPHVGCHFAFRATLETQSKVIQSAGHRRGSQQVVKNDESWPGMFINLRPENPRQPLSENNPPRLFMWLKADQRGHQINGPDITQTGWWTLGMSFSPDGLVHYYARPGVDDLTADDHLATSLPYGQRASLFRNFFFNVCNGDDGKTWSTPFIIDDPTLYLVH